MQQGMIYNIQRMSTADGPGLRTTVFLKGCPLRCLWCSNPESQSPQAQLMVFEDLCVGCGQCAQSCPSGAVIERDHKFNRDMKLCTNCGACVPGCPAKARSISGEIMTTEQVMKIARKDALFYQNSDGGVTFGGGEPTLGGNFLLEMLSTCRNEAFHTCIDTCGFCPEEMFRQVTELTDMFLFDLKHMDPGTHKSLTGQDNALIHANLCQAFRSKADVRIRMPLMPEINDSEKNLVAMAELLGEFGVHDIDVLPSHAFGRNKYAALQLPFPQTRAYAPEELEATLERFRNVGITPHIVK
ncbi:MAG: glycyl-radical enzyme activating protein [Desulfovibrio sp.]|jgi:pyruvate formate lyase activating enzyme|nr:glycyl-radical enzyme activating protein [Desulfovibrio sp.]